MGVSDVHRMPRLMTQARQLKGRWRASAGQQDAHDSMGVSSTAGATASTGGDDPGRGRLGIAPALPSALMSMTEKLELLARRRAAADLGGGAARLAAQHAKGKLSARERLDILLDDGSFVESDKFVTARTDADGNTSTDSTKTSTKTKRRHGKVKTQTDTQKSSTDTTR